MNVEDSKQSLVDKNEAFHIGILHAVAGGSLVVGIHELNELLVLAAPAVVLWFLTIMAAALGAAVVAAGLRANGRLGWMRRMMTAATTLVILGYALLLAASWYRFLTDPDMFEDMDSKEAVIFRS